MKALILKCPKAAKFRFGKAGLDVNSSLSTTDTLPHSDTLFSALVNTAFRVGGKTRANRLVDFFKNDELTISSASFCIELKDKIIFLLPKPVSFDLFDVPAEKRKKYRKVKFISKAAWEKGLSPESWDNINFWTSKVIVTAEERAFLPDIDKLYEEITRPRVTDQVRRPENNLYFQTELHFRQFDQINIHYFYLYETHSESVEKEFIAYNELLSDTGLGGRISLGCGRLLPFDSNKNILDFAIDCENPSAKYKASLSLINPKDKTELSALKFYDLITRGGRRVAGGEEDIANTATTNILKRIKMLREGAVTTDVKGRVVDISPENSIEKFLRYGKAFNISINQNFIPDEYQS